MSIHGARYIHVLVPCPLGWGMPSHDTVRVGRLAVESGFFPLFEAEHGVVTASTPIRHRLPIDDYLLAQRRFAHLYHDGKPVDGRVARLQAMADENIRRFNLLRAEETEL